VIGRKVRDEVDLAGLEGGELRHRILDRANHDAIQIRNALLEVLVEAVHDQVGTLHPLDELEGAAADERLGPSGPALFRRVLLRHGGRDDDHPHAVRRQHVHHERVRLLESDLDGVGIDHLDRVHRPEELAHVGPVRGIQHVVERELDGGRVDLAAVVEQDVLSELEGVQEAV